MTAKVEQVEGQQNVQKNEAEVLAVRLIRRKGFVVKGKGQEGTDQSHDDRRRHTTGNKSNGIEGCATVSVNLVVHEKVDKRRKQFGVKKVGNEVSHVNGPSTSSLRVVGKKVAENRRQYNEEHGHQDDVLDNGQVGNAGGNECGADQEKGNAQEERIKIDVRDFHGTDAQSLVGPRCLKVKYQNEISGCENAVRQKVDNGKVAENTVVPHESEDFGDSPLTLDFLGD